MSKDRDIFSFFTRRKDGEHIQSFTLNQTIERMLQTNQIREAKKVFARFEKDGQWPTEETLNQLNLTERSLWVLTSGATLPGGAASHLAPKIWQRQVEESLKRFGSQKPILLIAGVHESYPAVDPDSTHPYGGSAANWNAGFHAAYSCGVSGGDSAKTRTTMTENMERFSQWLQKQNIRNVSFLPLVVYPQEVANFG